MRRAAVLFLAAIACRPEEHVTIALPDAAPRAPEPDVEPEVRRFCGRCHAFPAPDVLPRGVWEPEIATMYQLAGQLLPGAPTPQKDLVLGWYRSRAPESVAPPEGLSARGPGKLTLESTELTPPKNVTPPAVSSLAYVQLEKKPELLITDMRAGAILAMSTRGPRVFRQLGKTNNPAHAEVVDLDRDGRKDVLVADLGSLGPADHDLGRVVWLRAKPGGFEERVLLDRVGRVADARAADLDGDGDLDVVAAEFGWRTTGALHLLVNTAAKGRPPAFERRKLDPRPGALGVALVDLDRDGRLDIVATFAQQVESVLAFLNRGELRFDPMALFEAPHPDYGLNPSEVVDLDGDGDLDVLLPAGDVLDDSVVKPVHGVWWLENEGKYPFTARQLTTLAGATRARAADLDGDGDLDVVATSFLPNVPPEGRRKLGCESVIWLEQVAKGTFERWSLGGQDCDVPALEVADLSGSARPEIVIGYFGLHPELLAAIPSWLVVFSAR